VLSRASDRRIEFPFDAVKVEFLLRSNLATEMDRVCDDHAPIIVTRRAASSVVMISLDDYEALEETAHLLRSPRNALRLLESIAALERGAAMRRPQSRP
jgi:antitoxin YefM